MTDDYVNTGTTIVPNTPIVFASTLPASPTAEDLTWAPPPPVNRGGRRPSQEWFDIAEKLRAKPGEWAIVKSAKSSSNASDIALRIRRGGIEAFAPAGSFEATSRSDGGDLFVVYAQFTGE